MKPVVIDTSATACWCIPDEQHDVGDFHYAQACRFEGLYHAPALWLWELGNTLAMAFRCNRLPKVHFERSLELVDLAGVEVDAIPTLHRRSQILRLAEAHRLTFYDATYLELVVRLNGTLVSRDNALVAAAQSCGIPCVQF